jgi:hypothetical protein
MEADCRWKLIVEGCRNAVVGPERNGFKNRETACRVCSGWMHARGEEKSPRRAEGRVESEILLCLGEDDNQCVQSERFNQSQAKNQEELNARARTGIAS